MRIIIALDDNNGMLFNHRRQSSDVAVRDRIKELDQRRIALPECLFCRTV